MDEEFYVEPTGRRRGLALWWQREILVNVWHNSKNIIHTSMHSSMHKVPNFVMFVYGTPRNEDKLEAWRKMRNIAAGIQGTWLCMGDFNDMVSVFEKEGSRPLDIRRALNFQSMLSDCGLVDLKFCGAQFTWCNQRLGDTNVEERIDRVVANVDFRESFPNALVFHIEPVGSDHHMLCVNCDYINTRCPKVFRFQAIWIEHEDYLNKVKEGWLKDGSMERNNVEELICRLLNCRDVEWGKKEFPNIRKIVEVLTKKLEVCRRGKLTEQSKMEMEELIRKIEEAWDREEVYWWQCSRVNWLNAGDRNTKFFHSSTIQRRVRNKIVRLKGEGKVWLEEEEINEAFMKFL